MRLDAISELIEAMVSGGGSRAESFFIARGLGAAYNSVGKYYGIQKHVNAALLQAEAEGRQTDIVREGLEAYGLSAQLTSAKEQQVEPTGIEQGRVFLSHASADKDLAEAIADLLRLGTGLSEDKILCTSLEGMGIPEGTPNYLEFIRSRISDAGLVLPLFTPAFFDSEVCLIETGAMWGLQRETFPLIVPPVTYARVEKLLGKLQGARIDQEEGLSRLHDRIVGIFKLKAKTDMWIRKKGQFEAKLPTLLSNLAEGTRASSSDLAAAQDSVAKHEARARELEQQVSDLRGQLEKMKSAKTLELLAQATAPHGSESEQFEALTEEVREALAVLPGAVREALYEDYGRSSIYMPGAWDGAQADAEDAVRDDLLIFDEERGGYSVNRTDPAVRAAVSALDGLFQGGWSEDFEEWFLSTYKKRFSVEVRAVWSALGFI